MSCWSASACDDISSAVDESSSAADAFRCVTWSTVPIAFETWPTPADCSADAAATSCTRSAVFRIAGTSSTMSCPERSATFTDDPASAPISFAAFCARSASLRTSVATTANPFPCSPARAASMAAFSASRFVW